MNDFKYIERTSSKHMMSIARSQHSTGFGSYFIQGSHETNYFKENYEYHFTHKPLSMLLKVLRVEKHDCCIFWQS